MRAWQVFVGLSVVIGLFALSAAGASAVDNLQHGIGFTKGCVSPTKIDDPYQCGYTIRNVIDDASDTLTIDQLVDTVNASGGPVVSGNILNLAQVTTTTTALGAIPSGATCTAASGTGVFPTPYVGVTSCTLPFGSRVNVLPYSHYAVLPGDWNLPGHVLTDAANLSWHDLCDGTPSGNCNADPPTNGAASQSSLLQLQSSTATDIHNAAHQVVTTVAAGSTVHDFVTVTGQGSHPNPTGNVSIDWFLNGTCSGSAAANSGPLGLDANGKLDATGFAQTVNSPGMVAFRATYLGDNRYAGSVGACEPLQVVDVDLQITKTGSPASQTVTDHPYGNITWTMVVTNNGPLADTNVTVGDPLPAGNTYVSSYATKGTCAVAAATLNCSLGTLQSGESVTITLVTTPTITGDQTNTAQVVGDLPETTLENNKATATVTVIGVIKPPPVCTTLVVRPKQFDVGQPATAHITVMKAHKPVRGVRVRIWGKGTRISLVTSRSDAKGKITQQIHPKKIGVLYFKPVASKACKVSRVGIAGVIHPTG